MMRYAALAAFLLFASSLAFAQQEQQRPCTHGAAQVKMAGIDMDEMRCRQAQYLQRIAELENEMIVLKTRALMQANDLDQETATRDKQDADLAAWFKAWFPQPAGK
jgi:hypothetical protein